MRQAVRLTGGPIARQREDGALPDEVRGDRLLVQLHEHRRQRLARMQLLRRRRILDVHIHHEVSVCCEERHLPLGIAAIRAMRVSLDELVDHDSSRSVAQSLADGP